MGVIRDPELETLLATLHARSDEQIELMRDFHANSVRPTEDEIKTFRSDKFVALDRDKAEFCYQLCRAYGAQRIVEVGTSYGVSPSTSPRPYATMLARTAATVSSSVPNTSRTKLPLQERTLSRRA